MNLNRYELAAIKKTAQIIKPKRAKLAKLDEKKAKLDEEIEALKHEIELWEAPIITKHGYSSEQILSGEADTIAAQTESIEAVEPEEVNMPETFVGYSQVEGATTLEGTITTSASIDEDPFNEPEL